METETDITELKWMLKRTRAELYKNRFNSHLLINLPDMLYGVNW